MDLFVTAADTEIGKTVVTAAIATACEGRVVVIKPVQTGCPPDDDAAWVATVTGAEPLVLERYETRAGPATCAVLEGRSLSPEDLVTRTLEAPGDVRLCEAAGGFLSPLDDEKTMADLAVALGWPVVAAVRPDLGTLGVTGLLVEAVRARGLDLVGLVVTGYTGEFPQEDNLVRLGRIAPVLGVVPHLDDFSGLSAATRWNRRPPWEH